MDNLAKIQMRKHVSALRPGSSAGLTEQLVGLVELLGVSSIASYSPLPSEPDVSAFNSWVAGVGQLYLPRIENEQLVFASGDLKPGPFGLSEPAGQEIELATIELFVIPALAADIRGNRLGKGKGFYDRLLARISAPCAAVVFDNELVEQLGTEEHDRSVDFVVTPSKTISCRG